MVDWSKLGKDVLNTIAAAAPVVGSAIGGPLGGVAGAALAKVLGCEQTPEAVEAAVKNDPEALLKLRQADHAYHLELERLKLEKEKAELRDVANAREREKTITVAIKRRDYALYILAGVVTIGFFAVVGILMKFDLPASSKDACYLLLGSLAAGFGQMLQYFFGSSKGSADKNDMLKLGVGGAR